MFPNVRSFKLKFFITCLIVFVLLLWTFIDIEKRDGPYIHGNLQIGRDVTFNTILSNKPTVKKHTNSTNDLYKTPSEVFADRKRRIDEVCSSKQVKGQVHGVFTSGKVIYCFVPKAGCTFWKRVFRALNSSVDDPYSISRNLVHSNHPRGVPYDGNHSQRLFPTRFIVTRDPYARLLSSYLDKFYLPDFWSSEARDMIRNRPENASRCSSDFLRAHFDKISARFDNGSDTMTEVQCGKYMTFAEFVVGGLNVSEPHWMPVHKICNPCLFNVTHVSRMETFNQDARVILGKMGIDQVLDHFNQVTQVDEEIETIVDYNFNKIHESDVAEFFNRCITPLELAYRLWHNFRWRGYIDPDMKYVVPAFLEESKVKDDLMRQIRMARESGMANPERMDIEKRNFKELAFQTIPKQLFQALTEKYETDFQLFGYEDVRDKLYRQLYEA